MEPQEWYLYILECSDGSYYTGITDDLVNRVIVHNRGNGPDYTRRRRPVTLRYWEKYNTKSESRKREIQLKGWSRVKKQKLFVGFLRLPFEVAQGKRSG